MACKARHHPALPTSQTLWPFLRPCSTPLSDHTVLLSVLPTHQPSVPTLQSPAPVSLSHLSSKAKPYPPRVHQPTLLPSHRSFPFLPNGRASLSETPVLMICFLSECLFSPIEKLQSPWLSHSPSSKPSLAHNRKSVSIWETRRRLCLAMIHRYCPLRCNIKRYNKTFFPQPTGGVNNPTWDPQRYFPDFVPNGDINPLFSNNSI